MCAIQKLSWFNKYKACFQLADYEPLRPSLEAMICPDPSCEDKAAVSTALKCQPTWDIWSRCNWYNGCSALFSLWTERGRNDQIHAQGTGQQGLTLTWQGHTRISDSYSSLHQPDVPANAIWTHVQKRANEPLCSIDRSLCSHCVVLIGVNLCGVCGPSPCQYNITSTGKFFVEELDRASTTSPPRPSSLSRN